MQTAVLGLADMELTFFIAVCVVLYFRFVAITVLVTHQSFDWYSAIFAQHQDFIFSPLFPPE